MLEFALIAALALVFIFSLYVWRTFPIMLTLWRAQASQAATWTKLVNAVEELGYRVDDLESEEMKELRERLDLLEEKARESAPRKVTRRKKVAP